MSDDPHFENMPKEQVNEYLRLHGYDPEQVRIHGKVFIEAFLENMALRIQLAVLTQSSAEEVDEFNAGFKAYQAGLSDDETEHHPHDQWRVGYAWAAYPDLRTQLAASQAEAGRLREAGMLLLRIIDDHEDRVLHAHAKDIQRAREILAKYPGEEA